MAKHVKATTVAKLRRSGYTVGSVREELRRNLIKKLSQGEMIFPGIVGYEDTVGPQMENAILSGQDLILLGERGQAKSRLLRGLVNLLDEEIPYIAGCEIYDNPYKPICRACLDKVARDGDNVPIGWLSREERYSEKLATPDISLADLIGEVDPIKVAEGRYLADELTIHYGLIPRTNRGIFCINELPDLPERIQVGMFNLLEERDIQIKGYRIRLPLDILVVATANPEDYTNRGRIITPLKDRYGSQIRTHYPRLLEQEIYITEQERTRFSDMEEQVFVPDYMKEIIAEFTALARQSPEINQRSGVSVRVSIANHETLMAASLRRAIQLKEHRASPRISDLGAITASTAGKIELETTEEGREIKVIEELTKKAILNTFGRYFTIQDFEDTLKIFDEGLFVETGPGIPSSLYEDTLERVGGLGNVMEKLQAKGTPCLVASAVEFILEGLHLNRRLNRERSEGKFQYRG